MRSRGSSVSSFSRWSPQLHAQPAGEHVHGALAALVVVRERLGAGRHPKDTHINVARAGRRLGDLGASEHAPRNFVVWARLDDSHGGESNFGASGPSRSAAAPGPRGHVRPGASCGRRRSDPRSLRCKRRLTSWQSLPGSTSTWADSAGNPEVTSQMCRSWTSSTPGSAASARPISVGVEAGRRGLHEHARRLSQQPV